MLASFLCLSLAVTSFLHSSIFSNAAEDTSFVEESLTEEDYRDLVSTYSSDKSIPYYKDYISAYPAVFPEDELVIEGSDYSRYEEDGKEVLPVIYQNYDGMEGDSLLMTEYALVEYTFKVQSAGYYDMSLLYYPIAGKSSTIQRSFFIDGKLPYRELAMVEFARIWTGSIEETYLNDDGITTKKWVQDNQGNDLKPTSVEIPSWVTSPCRDYNGYVVDDLKVYLEAGEHTLTLLSQREPMLLKQIVFYNGKTVQPYETVKKAWDASGCQATSGKEIRIEGENVTRTSSQMLYPKQDQSSPAVYPVSPKSLLNNTIGGTSWQSAGQWVEWDFEAPEDGYYNIAVFAKQNFVRGIKVSRKITIDGEVPFKEMEQYGFAYKQNWHKDVLADAEDNPYSFYLTKGTHTLRMEVVLGDFSEVIATVQSAVQDLNSIYRRVIRITGVSPDEYRDYQIASSLPGLQGDLQIARDKIDGAITSLQAISGSNTDKTTTLITMRDQLDLLMEDEERFTEVISSFKINVRACGNWINQVVKQPLQIDRIFVYSPDQEPVIKSDNWWSRFIFEIKRLFCSFVIDYNQIGNVTESDEESTTLTLWVGTGRDQANVIKSLIDESFTPDTGINVNVQLVDMSTLLKAELAGEGPDVAIQVGPTQMATGIAAANMVAAGNDTPVNYGIRNAVLDLSAFPDFEEVLTRFSNSATCQFSYGGATYALPDTQTFPMMFYRKDILNEIGMEVPRTWDEVKVAMTVLSKNQMEFGMVPGEQIFAMLLFQQGGAYYKLDGMASDLDSDIAVNVFKQYCEFYTDYRLDKETSAEERFRTGECPIIIADYTVFNNLAVSAPDIEGLWDFTVVPGTRNPDGSINHTTGSTGLADMIMASTEYPEESWGFLKWWTSAETQTLFGREMESLMGSAGRVATANMEALGNLSWKVEDYRALMEQFAQVQGIPQVPGGYYSWRNVNNAFYAITTDDSAATPREELMEKVGYINDEINYKREELGLPIFSEE